MKLQSLLPHMLNNSVRVDGVTYRTDSNGVTTVNDEKHIQKLLSNSAAWRPYVERVPVSASGKPTKPVAKPAPVAELAKVIKPEPVSEPEPELEDREEYPDPTMSMTLARLQEIAGAYEVPYTSKTTKRELVDAIMVAMYGE